MKLLAIGALAMSLSAQISLRFNPEPMEVLRALHAKHFGRWTVSICNEGALPRRVAPEQVYGKAGALKVIGPNVARLMLSRRQALSAPAVIVRGAEYVATGATVVTASKLLEADPEWTAGSGLGIAVMHLLADRLRGEIPDTAPLLADLLETQLILGPGECATKALFSGLVKAAAPFTARIE